MTARLYVVPGSHPSMSGRLMLEHKRLEYRRVDLLPAIHKPLLRLLGFPGTTVPALRIEGRRIQGTLEISRALDALASQATSIPGRSGRACGRRGGREVGRGCAAARAAPALVVGTCPRPKWASQLCRGRTSARPARAGDSHRSADHRDRAPHQRCHRRTGASRHACAAGTARSRRPASVIQGAGRP